MPVRLSTGNSNPLYGTTVPQTVSVDASALTWMAYPASRDEIDLRAEIAEILENRGHWAYLRRRLQQKAPSFDEDVGQGRPLRDPLSWHGYLYQDEPYKIRSRPTTSEARGAADDFLTDIGRLTVRHRIFYFQYYVKPSIHDGIIEVKLNEDGSIWQPPHIEKIFDIQLTMPFRDQGGRIEYWSVLAEEVIGK